MLPYILYFLFIACIIILIIYELMYGSTDAMFIYIYVLAAMLLLGFIAQKNNRQ